MYLAEEKPSDRQVAIKIIRGVADSESIVERSASLLDCTSPFLVKQYGVQKDGKELWVGLTDSCECVRLAWNTAAVDLLESYRGMEDD